jgi:phage portal protein BeeE
MILARKMEAAVDAALPVGQNLKVDFNQMLRADTSARYAAYKTGLEAGFLTIDEVRIFEDLPPMAELPTPEPEPTEGGAA